MASLGTSPAIFLMLHSKKQQRSSIEIPGKLLRWAFPAKPNFGFAGDAPLSNFLEISIAEAATKFICFPLASLGPPFNKFPVFFIKPQRHLFSCGFAGVPLAISLIFHFDKPQRCSYVFLCLRPPSKFLVFVRSRNELHMSSFGFAGVPLSKFLVFVETATKFICFSFASLGSSFSEAHKFSFLSNSGLEK